jgi:hypothetical protein
MNAGSLINDIHSLKSGARKLPHAYCAMRDVSGADDVYRFNTNSLKRSIPELAFSEMK